MQHTRKERFLLVGKDMEEVGRVPIPLILQEPIIIDSHKAVIVFAFPRYQQKSMLFETPDFIEDAMHKAEKTFVSRTSCSHSGTESSSRVFPGHWMEEDAEISVKEFQNVIRMQVLQEFRSLGLQVEYFESIDEDEVFLKVSINEESDMLSKVAEKYGYMMPLSNKAYVDTSACAGFAGGTAPCYPESWLAAKTSMGGFTCPRFATYSEEFSDLLEPFRSIDKIRLVKMLIEDRLSIDCLKHYGVITACFPAIEFYQLQQLDGCTLKALCTNADIEDVRNYFGEDLAFLFMFLSLHCKSLFLLAVVACIVCMTRWMLDLCEFSDGVINFVYGSCVLTWGIAFLCYFEYQCKSAAQRWGMHDDAAADIRVEYEGARGEACLPSFVRIFGVVIPWLFCCMYIVLVYRISTSAMLTLDKNLVVSGVRLACAFLWGKIAPKLVYLMNVWSKQQWHDAMALQLTPVKLFLVLFPLFELAVFKRYWQPFIEHGGNTCAPSLDAAARMLYGNATSQVPWPEAVVPLVAQGDFGWLDLKVWSFTAKSWWVSDFLGLPVNQTCIRGCFPVVCDLSKIVAGVPTCYSECHYELKQLLTMFYVTIVGPIILNLLLPIGLVWWQVHSELVSQDVSGRYTILQFQAKCARIAPYHYGQKGGSYTDDMLGIAISFAVLMCFGTAMPELAIAGFAVHAVAYSLFRFRMKWVICRPWPTRSHGISAWSKLFNAVTHLAILTNACVLSFSAKPLNRERLSTELIAFLLLENLGLLLRYTIRQFFDVNMNVQSVDHFHAHNHANLASMFMSSREEARSRMCEQAWMYPFKDPYKLTDVSLTMPADGERDARLCLSDILAFQGDDDRSQSGRFLEALRSRSYDSYRSVSRSLDSSREVVLP